MNLFEYDHVEVRAYQDMKVAEKRKHDPTKCPVCVARVKKGLDPKTGKPATSVEHKAQAERDRAHRYRAELEGTWEPIRETSDLDLLKDIALAARAWAELCGRPGFKGARGTALRDLNDALDRIDA